jgi:hypothetical protein
MSTIPNVGEWGVTYNLNTNYNLSGYTSLSMAFDRPDGSSFTRTGSDVTAPAVALVTDDSGTFAANQYATYNFKAGDLTVPGTYIVRLTYEDATKHLVSDFADFAVKL